MTSAKKDTPGSGTKTDTSGNAATDQKSDRKDSGQKGAAEDKVRKDQIQAGLEKAAKHAAETGTPAPVVVEPVQDRAEVVGDESRDVTRDPDYEPGAGTLPQHEVFVFDRDAKTTRVDHIAVASTANGLVLELDGKYYGFDTQLAAALRRLVSAGAVNLNL